MIVSLSCGQYTVGMLLGCVYISYVCYMQLSCIYRCR